MGQLPLTKEHEPGRNLSNILKETKNFRQYFDPHYGDIYFIEAEQIDRQRRFAIKETFLTADQSSNQKELRTLEKIMNFHKKTEGLVRLDQYHLVNEGSFCSSVLKLYQVLEYFDRDLFTEIRSKRLQQTFYSEAQILEFLLAMSESLGALQSEGIPHQNLKTTTILLDTQNKSYRIFDPRLFPTAPAFLQVMNAMMADPGSSRLMKNKYTNNDLGMYYPSPQQLSGLTLGCPDMKFDCFKSDVFTLGVIVVELITLENCYPAYDFDLMMVSRLRLLENVRSKADRYSPFLLKLLETMLKEKETDRPDFPTLLELVKARRREMNDLKHDLKPCEDLVVPKSTTPIRDIDRKIKDIDKGLMPPGKAHPLTHTQIQQKSAFIENFESAGHQAKGNEGAAAVDPQKYFSFGPLSKEILKPLPQKEEEPLSNLGSDKSKKENESASERNPIAVHRPHSEPPFTPIAEPSASKVYVHEKYEHGACYEGEKVGELREGKGRYTYKEGGTYNGDWRAGKMHGFGCLFYPNGSLAYEGMWIEDQFSGRGIVYNESPLEVPYGRDTYYFNLDTAEEFWTKYEGDFLKDNKHGGGTIFFSNGDTFVGTFVEDLAEGEGLMKFKSGKTLKGVWSENQLIKIL